MTLMSGAMLGFAHHQMEFDVISTSGVGGLIGMLYLAPKGNKSREEALEALPNLFISDLLYAFLPVNFKVFSKHGPFSELWWKLGKAIPRLSVQPQDASPLKRLINDWIDLSIAATTPSTYESFSQGLMTQVPLIDDLVDFERLRQSSTKFYLNAFNVSEKKLHIFDNTSMEAQAYAAAQAMFFLFSPERVAGGDLFSSGSTHDPTGLLALCLKDMLNFDILIMLDPLSAAFWREPVNVYDAFQLMLMNPILALEVRLFGLYAALEHRANSGSMQPGHKLPKLYRVPFDVPPDYYPTMLQWTHSNAIRLQNIGYQAALQFAHALQADDKHELEFYRLYPYVKDDPLLQSFLPIFEPFLVRLSDGPQ